VHVEQRDQAVYDFIYDWLNNLAGFRADTVLVADAFALRLFKHLGYDFAHDAKLHESMKRLVECLTSDFKNLNNLNIDKNTIRQIHSAVYHFCTYHAEEKLPDWSKLEKLI